MNNLAERLRWARKQKNWTQQQLADHAGVAGGTVGNLESGRPRKQKGKLSQHSAGVDAGLPPGTRKIPELARALGVSPKWLAGEADATGAAHQADTVVTVACVPRHAVVYLDQQQLDLIRAWADADDVGRALLKSAITVINQSNEPIRHKHQS